MYIAYKNIFDRVGLKYKIVKADTGVMGGFLSEEFQALTDTGEDTIVLCDKCDYASNLEVATCTLENLEEEKKALELVHTPNCRSIEEVCNFLNVDCKNSVKALLMNVNEELVVFFVRGDRELNELKASKLLGVNEINFANDELINKSNAVPGFTGPIDLNCKVVIDEEILNMKNFCCGANKDGYHYINVNVDNIKYDIAGDIKQVVHGDICPNCGGHLYLKKGIEVGNIFKLGTKYCESLNISYLDQNNKLNYPYMGCYGIGIPRIMASIVEQSNDDKGIIWPLSIAPFKVSIIVVSTKDENQMKIANDLYDTLNKSGIDTILDDRDERVGVKFNDMDLIGVPIRITVGKRIVENKVELKLRNQSELELINLNDVVKRIKDICEGE